jgi:hypothetical protein
MQRLESISEACIEQYSENGHGIEDASVCHGHAGVALAFAAFASTKGIDQGVASKLSIWADRAAETTLAMEVESDRGPAFLFSSSTGMRDFGTFLEGGPGVALALSAMSSPGSARCLDLLGYY